MKPRKNFIAKDLFSKKYKSRVVKPKKGKGSFKRKKNSYFNISTLKLITILSSSDEFMPTECGR